MNITTDLCREEVLHNRQLWVKALRMPRCRKATGVLDAGNGLRCCLGHGSYALGVQRWSFLIKSDKTGRLKFNYAYGEEQTPAQAPREFVRLVGLRTSSGDLNSSYPVPRRFSCFSNSVNSLTALNDDTTHTPQMIADFLERNITGELTEVHTPFIPLSTYPSNPEWKAPREGKRPIVQTTAIKLTEKNKVNGDIDILEKE